MFLMSFIKFVINSMKKLIIIVFVVFLSLSGKAQFSAEFGCVTGLTYYMGDMNSSEIFYKPNMMYGFMYRYNINETYSLRLNVGFGKLEAKDIDFDNGLQQARANRFFAEYTNFNINLEYNFYPFWVPKKKWSNYIVPFISSGLGYVVVDSSPTLAIPMTLGVKCLAFKRVTIGLEWNYAMTFSDKIDGMEDPMKTGKSSKLINNDWIAYGAISIAYRFTADRTCMLFNKIRKNGFGNRRR